LRLDPRRIKLATTVYDVEEITLQNGAKVTLKPLSIKELRKFMVVMSKTANIETCGGIKMDDPNLLAAAVLAGQN
jgi:hypothetical protein